MRKVGNNDEKKDEPILYFYAAVCSVMPDAVPASVDDPEFFHEQPGDPVNACEVDSVRVSAGEFQRSAERRRFLDQLPQFAGNCHLQCDRSGPEFQFRGVWILPPELQREEVLVRSSDGHDDDPFHGADGPAVYRVAVCGSIQHLPSADSSVLFRKRVLYLHGQAVLQCNSQGIRRGGTCRWGRVSDRILEDHPAHVETGPLYSRGVRLSECLE